MSFASMVDPVLPSMAAIQSSTDMLSNADASATVVRVGKHVAVKYGHGVSLQEAANLSFLSACPRIPAPKLHATYTDPQTGINYLLMEYIAGQTLQQMWSALSVAEKESVTSQIKDVLSALRELPSLGYIGSLNREPCADGIFCQPEADDLLNRGPFANEDEMNNAIINRLQLSESAEFVTFMQRKMSRLLHGHSTVFTHGDLQPKNIMLTEMSRDQYGTRAFRITLIDWEVSGWYPEYWEYCNAALFAKLEPYWYDLIATAFTPYHVEYLLLEDLREIFWS